jgi:hypothetical protein
MFLALKNFHEFRLLSCTCSENQAHGCPIRTARGSAGCLRGEQFRGVEAIYFTGHGQRGVAVIIVAGNDLVDSLRLAGVTGHSYSLVDMQSGPSANNLAFIEYDLAIINADHGPELVIEELLPAVFDVFRESDPVADGQRDFHSLEHTEFPCLVERQLLLDAVFSDNDGSLLPAKDFPLLAAFKSLFLDSSTNGSQGSPMKLDDLPWLISDHIALSGAGQFSR